MTVAITLYAIGVVLVFGMLAYDYVVICGRDEHTAVHRRNLRDIGWTLLLAPFAWPLLALWSVVSIARGDR